MAIIQPADRIEACRPLSNEERYRAWRERQRLAIRQPRLRLRQLRRRHRGVAAK